MNKVKTNDIPTAGVTIKDDSLYLYWNPDFLDSLSTKQCFGLLKHECYHLIFKHIIKRKHDPHLLWNIATDLAINSIIPYRELPKGGFVPGKPLKIPIRYCTSSTSFCTVRFPAWSPKHHLELPLERPA